MEKAKKQPIPQEVKQEVLAIIKKYNKEHKETYQIAFRGANGYLTRVDDLSRQAVAMALVARQLGIAVTPNYANAIDNVTKIGRLEWEGDMKSWDFVMYRYSKDKYDPEAMFYLSDLGVDGTIQSMLKAGRKIYP